ncbi:hypothetical protein Y10_17700 [Neptunitalea sp. Y10]|uniref:BIG2 domain-containing protein n=2 Tax=Neptunitalea lumnitzerae TaxID=2965509 RepID=A0ABQ5MJ98_9FLAO|nr:hypothetical protein Y10_17700 [Neptunitalea sp. Y10]
MYSQTLEQAVLVDFGPTGGTNGAITNSPDMNNNYWNNATVASTGTSFSLINTTNGSTPFTLSIADGFVLNSSVNYGPTAANSTTLGDLAISTATQDYFYLENGGSGNNVGQLIFSNLDNSKSYKFILFASRPTSSVRETAYTFTGQDTYNASLQTSDGASGNLTNFVETTYLTPANGEITLDVSIVSGGYGYVNLIKVEEYSGVSTVEATAVTVTGSDITVSGQTSVMQATVAPVDATYPDVEWSVDDTNIAVISETGILSPVNNGTVTVTATNIQNPTISGSTTITVSNQIKEFYISGTATENGDVVSTALPMHMVTGLDGVVTNIFEIYTSLADVGTFSFYTGQDSNATVYGSSSTAGQILQNGTPINSNESGPVLISLDLNNNSYIVTPINWSVVGSSIPNGWNGDEPLNYQGGGVWSALLDMTTVTTDPNPRFVFKGNQSWSYVMKKIPDTHDVVMESQANTYNTAIQDIDLGYGNFVITLDLSSYKYSVACADIDDYKISFLGSSVMNGQGATNMEGYAYLYDQLLQERSTNGSSPFYRSNISVNGNNTLNVLDRYEKDLIADCSSYVIFGLALGNEGIHENGQAAFDQYENNMQLLIQKAINDGKTPVVMNNYTREDYNAADYEYIKQMNIIMAQWNVPSINLLGAIDNGTGNWPLAYQDDLWHPNTAGHQEFFYAMVPSLFDALESGKATPELHTNTSITPNTLSPGHLSFTPENVIHPFTMVLNFKTSETGQLFEFTSASGDGAVSIDTNGHLVYTSPFGGTIVGNTLVNDNVWHSVTLSHYYAQGATKLYSDAIEEGILGENLEASMFTVHGNNAPTNISYKNWYFYRAGMNALEIAALNNNQLLQSSLELYAPLDGDNIIGSDPYINLAQSTNTIDATNFALGLMDIKNIKDLKIYPNPVKDILQINTLETAKITSIEIFNLAGAKIIQNTHKTAIDVSMLQNGMYLVKVNTRSGVYNYKIVKQ